MNIKKTIRVIVISIMSIFIFNTSLLFADQISSKSLIDESEKKNNLLNKIESKKWKDQIIKNKTKSVYLNLQHYLMFPQIGLGFRQKINTYGYDLNFALEPTALVNKIIIIDLNGNLLKYFGPKNNPNYFIGLGATSYFLIKNYHINDNFSFSPVLYAPTLCIGKNFKKFEKSFIQVKVAFPTYYIENTKPILVPNPSLSIGIGF